ncbi:ribonuclease R [Ureaplasma diversum]|uniref:Ribonuclease R n=1 Tax=Ureaplasma diversum NCTC 246 TaxID=1188241 RepID=A0A084EX79_9BACT|nr:ribonuclease R [Ureaplasma diversum]KEZ22571.1 Ribonuclease R [Ureaplasma diversum NCTC 246]
MDNQSIRKLLIDLMQKEERPIPINILVRKAIEKNKNVIKTQAYKVVDQLIKDNTLRQLPNEKLVLAYLDYEFEHEIKEGTIKVNSKGDGFILETDTQTEYYVNKKYLNGALKNDLVKFVKLKKEPKNDIYDAAVVEVVAHEKDCYVGKFVQTGTGYYVSIDDPLFYLNVILDDTKGLVNGHKILIRINSSNDKDAYGSVVYIVGHENDPGADILSIVYDNGVDPKIDPEVNEAANQAVFEVDEHQSKIRRYLVDREIISIDPVGSKDIDDAVCVQKLPDGKFFLGVSIADVSYYVQPDTVLDADAFKRGTSVYLVDRVIPMLPHNLSNNICSLNANVERMCVTCDMVINTKGEIIWKDVYPAIMKSKRQMSYNEVNDFYENKNHLEDVSISIHKMLNEAKELHQLLRAKKQRQGFVDFDIKEPKIIIDENGVPVDVVIYERKTAQLMIEDFMIAANEAVAEYVQDFLDQDKNQQNIDMEFIYRVHDSPNIENLEKFSIEAKKLAFNISKDFSDVQPNTISNWLKQNENHPNLALVSKLLLRAMAKASYEIKNSGHFGLASEYYTHFTSPIRRYPDLIVHRLLWMFLFDPKSYTDQQRTNLIKNLKTITSNSNKTEIIAVKTERDVNAAKFAEFMSTKIGQEFNATISTVTSFGVFVELENTIEGLVRIKNIGNDFFEFVPENFTMVGQKTNKVITVGQKVRVRVLEANKITRKIDFEIIAF